MDLSLQAAIGLLGAWRVEFLLGVALLVLAVILLLAVRISGRLPADGFAVLRERLAGSDPSAAGAPSQDQGWPRERELA